MKKKPITIIVIVLILANVFLPTNPVSNNQSRLTLVMLEARADEGGSGETDPPDPGEEHPPLRQFPEDLSISAIIDYIFN